MPRSGCKHPVILGRFRLRENASYTCGACVDALAGGMVGKSEREEWHAQCVYPESDFKKIKTFDLV